jgi:hypothetical protein
LQSDAIEQLVHSIVKVFSELLLVIEQLSQLVTGALQGLTIPLPRSSKSGSDVSKAMCCPLASWQIHPYSSGAA